MDKIETTKVTAGELEFELPPEACRRLFLAGAIRYCKECSHFHPCPDTEDQIVGFVYALKCLAVRSNLQDGPGATHLGHPAEGVGPPHEMADEHELNMAVIKGRYKGFKKK